ncbi:site-specific integrase [Sandaracinobacteroides hominis]|uniref:site-specific integrase n=1 Tax=Sandaracinobacteroides hominis TaxID=2780086 RepID=UPI0018F6B53A|nr:site-specific integrase [Sandaracinobacteroides hominis]
MHHKKGKEVFKLSQRKGSTLWQVRKRWPQDVAELLKGEFTRSTGEGDKRKAQALIPVIAGEYERLVQQARDRLADSTQRDMSRAEILRLAAAHYADVLAFYAANKVDGVESQRKTITGLSDDLAYREAAFGREDYQTVRQSVNGLIEREGLPVPEDSPSRTELERLAMLARMEALRQTIARLQGQPAPPFKAEEIGEIVAASGKPKKTVTDLLDAYEAAKTGGWSESSKSAFSPVRRLLRDSLGDREVATLTRDDARKVQGLVKRLPRNLGKLKALEGLPVPQAVEKAERLELPTVTAKTMNGGYLVHIMAVFAWAMQEGWTPTNLFLKLAVADDVADEDRRDPFTTEQLQHLFTSEPWTAPATPDMALPGRFWVPLLGLFQGARRGELVGLQMRDVVEIEGILSLHIRDNDIRNLKNRASRRVVPVHPSVLELGFGQYVEHRRQHAPADALLFPDQKDKARGQIGYNLGVWFGKKINAYQMQGRNLSLHSFRHNFEDALRRAGLHKTPIGLGLAGRDDGGSAASYGSGYVMSDFAEPLARVRFAGLDLSHLKVANDE